MYHGRLVVVMLLFLCFERLKRTWNILCQLLCLWDSKSFSCLCFLSVMFSLYSCQAEQSVVDRAINDICILLHCSRHNLNVVRTVISLLFWPLSVAQFFIFFFKWVYEWAVCLHKCNIGNRLRLLQFEHLIFYIFCRLGFILGSFYFL